MKTHAEIIDAFEDRNALAAIIGVNRPLVDGFRHRNSIPSRYWLPVTDAAAVLGVPGVTLQVLARCVAKNMEDKT